MNYKIKITSANIDITLPTSEFEQLGEAIKRFIQYGFRDGSIHWHGVSIVECGVINSLPSHRNNGTNSENGKT